MGILNDKIPFCSMFRDKRCKMCKTRTEQMWMYDKKGRWGRSDYQYRIFPLLFVGKYCSRQCFELDNPGKVVEQDQLTKAGEKAMKARKKEAATAAAAMGGTYRWYYSCFIRSHGSSSSCFPSRI